MAYGRIQRSRAKILKAHLWTGHTAKVSVHAFRTDAGVYGSYACLGKQQKHYPNKSCAIGYGRTPQSAMAKSLKYLGNKISRRGKRR